MARKRAAAPLKRRRKAFREMNLGRIGLVGLVLMMLVMAVALNIGKLRTLVDDSIYTADFAEAGGLRGGDEVRVAGLKVGKVNSIELSGDQVEVTFGLSGVELGDQSRASIKSDNALGSKFLAIEPWGSGATKHIPIARTDAGISVNDELGRLTSSTAEIDGPCSSTPAACPASWRSATGRSPPSWATEASSSRSWRCAVRCWQSC